jgi:hypothetical protein
LNFQITDLEVVKKHLKKGNMKIKIIFCLISISFLTSCQESKKTIQQGIDKNDSVLKISDSLETVALFNIENNSKAEIDVLFSQKNGSKDFIYFGKALYQPLEVCFDKTLIIKIGSIHIKIFEEGVQIIENELEFICPEKIKSFSYLTNMIVTLNEKGIYETAYDTIPKKISLSHAEIIVTSLKDLCNDTGNNPFEVQLDSGRIVFNEIENLQFFEYDLDQNGRNEIYVVNFASCMSYITILRIQD